MKKVFIHAYTEQNLGDDMFIEYLCNRYPTVDFYIFCKNCYETALSKISNLNILKHTEYHFSTDFYLQIIIGGSIFMQSVNKGIFKKYSSDKKNKIFDVPTYIIGANFGPYKSIFFRLLYKHWFKSIDGIVFRDRYSYDLFRLNNMAWAPDILFNYNLPDISTKRIVSISCIKQNFRSGLNDYNEDLYFQKLAEVAEIYSRLGFSINLAAFSKAQEDDIAAKMIYNFLSPQAKSMTEISIYQGNIDTFLKKLLSSSYIIGTRFHSVILGWNAGIPVFPICYNSKLKNAIDSYEFKGNYVDISKICDIDFSYIDLNRTVEIGVDTKKLKKEANNHFLILDELLKE